MSGALRSEGRGFVIGSTLLKNLRTRCAPENRTTASVKSCMNSFALAYRNAVIDERPDLAFALGEILIE